jgi:hypothetical protein
MKIKLTRQVTDGNTVLHPGEHEVPDTLAKLYLERGWAEPVTDKAAGDEPALKQGRRKA